MAKDLSRLMYGQTWKYLPCATGVCFGGFDWIFKDITTSHYLDTKSPGVVPTLNCTGASCVIRLQTLVEF